MDKVINAVLTVLFTATDPILIGIEVLYLIGLWGIFVKCGLPGWQALIPGYRYVALGKAAVRELEGRVLCALEIFADVLLVSTDFLLNIPEGVSILLSIIALAAEIIEIVYIFRIYVGLCQVFDRKRKWLWLWMIPVTEFIPAFLWGWRKKYQPLWKVQDTEAATSAYFSGAHAESLGKGLTVNLEERSVSDFFKKKYLLRDIHMNIEPGHMVLLLGGSGAGKTTFVNAVNGYEKAKAEVLLNGENIYKHYKKMQYDIGFVPQQDLMRGNDTVLHTLLDAASLRLPKDFKPSERRARVDEVMEIFGLLPVKDNLVSKLSGGQRKRLSISMEYLSDPTLFILDEPDSGLDGVMARELMSRLRSIADRGKIVMVITHTPDRVIDMFDDVIVLAKDKNRTGRLAFFGSIADSRTFFGREHMEELVKCVNRKEEGGDGLADDFIMKFAEVQHG